jgi:hypothetical protein
VLCIRDPRHKEIVDRLTTTTTAAAAAAAATTTATTSAPAAAGAASGPLRSKTINRGESNSKSGAATRWTVSDASAQSQSAVFESVPILRLFANRRRRERAVVGRDRAAVARAANARDVTGDLMGHIETVVHRRW